MDKRSIVIISHDMLFPKLFEPLLRRKIDDLKIVVCRSVQEIDKVMDDHRADLTLLDAIVEGTPSFEIMRHLRMEKKLITPIFFFPEIQSESYAYKAYVMGASHIIYKPFDPHLITDEIANLFHSANTKNELI